VVNIVPQDFAEPPNRHRQTTKDCPASRGFGFGIGISCGTPRREAFFRVSKKASRTRLGTGSVGGPMSPLLLILILLLLFGGGGGYYAWGPGGGLGIGGVILLILIVMLLTGRL
jgi:hypothetical protein